MKKKKLTICLSAIFLVAVIIFNIYFTFAGSFNPEDERLIGYEFLDNNTVVHIWNNATISDYFFEKDAGIQLTNHYEDYWSRNIFCIGYYDGEEWVKIKCADELTDFNRMIDTDNSTYVNATLWKDITYRDYDLRLGINYYLGLNDKNLTITIYGKNIGIDIPHDLGFAWKVTAVDIPPSNVTDEITINVTIYPLNGTYNLLFKDMDMANFKIRDSGQYLKVDWNKNLNYAVKMYGGGNQEDFYVMLLVNAGQFNSGDEKSTTFYWIDAGGTCSGTPRSCFDHYEEYVCEMCGCFWKPYVCQDIPMYPCSSHTNQWDCQDCGCNWIPGVENFYVNIGDSWQPATDVYVNVGDVWRDVEEVYVNVGDVWRQIYSY